VPRLKPKTYDIIQKVDGHYAIRCRVCEMTSHNINDVEQKYCGMCHMFHDLGLPQFDGTKAIRDYTVAVEKLRSFYTDKGHDFFIGYDPGAPGSERGCVTIVSGRGEILLLVLTGQTIIQKEPRCLCFPPKLRVLGVEDNLIVCCGPTRASIMRLSAEDVVRYFKDDPENEMLVSYKRNRDAQP